MFNDRLWISAGNLTQSGSTYTQASSVWSSDDGIAWQQETDSVEFDARASHRIAELNNTLWMVGGHGRLGFAEEDIWSSTDGKQ
ncbi:MAG: hypothetical protein AAGF06_00355 [Pseudomonadota bacterium]